MTYVLTEQDVMWGPFVVVAGHAGTMGRLPYWQPTHIVAGPFASRAEAMTHVTGDWTMVQPELNMRHLPRPEAE